MKCVIAFLVATCSAIGSSPTPVSTRLAELESAYNARFSEARKEGANAVRSAVDQRNQEIRSLLQGELETQGVERSFEDFQALARASEIIKERPLCIAICRVGMRKFPDRHELYFPLVRSLLNLRSGDSAELVFADAIAKFPAVEDIPAIHGILAIYWERRAVYWRAASHSDGFLEYQVSVLDKRVGVGHQMERALNRQARIYAELGRTAELPGIYRGYDRLIQRQMTESSKNTEGVDEVMAVLIGSSQRHARFEIALRGNHDRAGDRLGEWFDFLFESVATRGIVSDSVIGEVALAARNIQEFSYLLGDDKVGPMRDDVARIRRAFENTSERDPQIVLIRQTLADLTQYLSDTAATRDGSPLSVVLEDISR